VGDPVKITFLLNGGHQQVVKFDEGDTQLAQIVGAYLSADADTKRGALVELAIEGGDKGLAFSLDQVIGLITEPLRPLAQLAAGVSAPSAAPAATTNAQAEAANTLAPAAYAHASPTVESRFLQIDDFLPPDVHRRLSDYAISRENDFVSTKVDSTDVNYRASSVLYQFPEFEALFRERLRAQLPRFLEHFGLAPFEPPQIEVQLTAHNDGNYYRVHNDNGSPQTANRQLTYVYYFNREPKAYSGGELRLYDSRIENNYYIRADSFRDVEPRNNSIVLFQSHCLHDVLPVRCPSRRFEDGRFTVNGWLPK
jgi:Rps23 Pro-64 3,4-dihydroxylase Tpa1-like proline 4-hydroxylase